MPKRKLTWYAPHWSFVPAHWRAFRPLLEPLFILRVTLASALIFGLIVAACKAALPQLQLDFLWRAAVALPAIYAQLAAIMVLHTLIPPHIAVKKNRLVIQHGQHANYIEFQSIVRTRLIVFAPDRIRLRIIHRGKRRLKSTAFGVSPKVNLQALYDLLPIAPAVRDARSRYSARFGSRYIE